MVIFSQQQDGFSNAALVSLVAQTLYNISPSLLLPNFKVPDAFSTMVFPAAQKRELLDYAYQRGGALAILTIGKKIGALKKFPIGQILIRSSSSDVLAQKWMRLEKYNHATHRLAIGCGKSQEWECKRYWTNNIPATAAENILICGLICGLLSFIGKQSINGTIGDFRFNWPVEPILQSSILGDTTKWRLFWRESFLKYEDPEQLPLSDGKSLSCQVQNLLAQDVGRNWYIDEVGETLAKSKRSLQRQIADEGHTFSSIVRQVRAEQATNLLLNTEFSLAEIGFCCGYSDQAHFQRDFKRSTNMAPKIFRKQ